MINGRIARATALKLLGLAALPVRVLRQGWARTPIYFGFGEYYAKEPYGWKIGNRVYDHPVPGAIGGNWHRGLDYPLSVGTAVTAALTGRVTHAGWDPFGYGLLVAIEGGRYICRYAHLSVVWSKTGVWQLAGTDVGLSGATGNVTGPHLHFEVFDKQLGAYVNPLIGPP